MIEVVETVPPYGLEETFVEVDQARLFCRSMGKGNPLIILHGGPGLSQDYLQPQMTKLADDHFVIFYDQRGSGRSEGNSDPLYISLNVFVSDLEAVRRHFGFEKVSVLGHSWGGFLALNYAASYPESIDKLIVLNSMPATSAGFALFAEEFARRTTPFTKELEVIQNLEGFAAGDSKTLAAYLKILFRTYCAIPEKADELNLEVLPEANLNFLNTSQIFNQTLFTSAFDMEEDLKKLSCQTLIIHGDKDPVPSSTAKWIHDHIENSQFALIEACGHFPFVEKPNELFCLLDTFLSGSTEP